MHVPNWGILPAAAHRLIRAREWDHPKHLQQRLTGLRAFPLVFPLKPPTGKQLMQDLRHFQHFVAAWQQSPYSCWIQWDRKNYRVVKDQQIPRSLVIPDMQALLTFLGADAVEKSQLWESQMAPLLAFNSDFYPVLIQHLVTVEGLSASNIQRLMDVLPQLEKGAGSGLYLRALPLVGVDTKFVETLQALISDLLDYIYSGQISAAGGLLSWLDCKPNPSGWLTVRPLSPALQKKLGGFSIVQLPTTELREQALPADNILVIENLQSGLSLPDLENTIAVFGGGRNVSWMDAAWLKEKHLGYWGDLDTWGLAILSDARALAANLKVLMMDQQTLRTFAQQMVVEPEKVKTLPTHLTEAETQLFYELKNDVPGMGRLEQEKLPADFVRSHLERWLKGS